MKKSPNKPRVKNIKIKFGKEIVILPTSESRVKTNSGVEIYIQERQTDYRPWAAIPDGTLEEHKHHRPEIIEWVEEWPE